MIKDITIGQYFPGNSVVHKLDPRVKIVLTLLFVVFIFVCHNFYSLALMVVSLLAIVWISKISLRTILKGIKPVLIIIVLTALLNLFYITDGKMLFEWHFLHITTKGVYTALFMVVRILCLIISSSMLTYTTSPTRITDGIEQLLSPIKFLRGSVHTIAMMMTIALRFIPTLIDEFDKITSAQKARGADLETGNLVERTKALVPVFIPLFITSFRRAYDLAFAMECRCYHGYEGRTRMNKMKTKRRDYIAIVVLLVIFAGIIVLNRVFGKVI